MFPVLDAPWLPIFVAVIFLLHPWLGWLAIAGSIALLALAVINELATARAFRMSGAASLHSLDQADAAVRNADVVQAMGMAPALLRRWDRQNGAMLALLDIANGRGGAIKSVSRCRSRSPSSASAPGWCWPSR